MSVRAAAHTPARTKPKHARQRADQLLVAQGLASDLRSAQALIMAGRVHSGGRRYSQPGQQLRSDTRLQVRGRSPYVSRGGDKLAAALDAWPVSLRGRICIDVGAAAGGFTDALLQRGAEHVIAVDVGYGQLHPRLRSDPRVTVLERTHIWFMPPLEPTPGLAAVDLSFIGLRESLARIGGVLQPKSDIIALVKPQFEALPDDVDEDGVVRDRRVQAAAVSSVVAWASGRGWRIGGVLRSPLVGPAGNREWFVWLRTP